LPRCLAPCGLALVLRRLPWRSDRQLQLLPPQLPADGRASAPAQALPKAHPRPPATVGAVHTENTAGSGGVTLPSEADRMMGGLTPAEPASDQPTSGDPNFEDTLRDLRRVFPALREARKTFTVLKLRADTSVL
jgi:glycine/D-amino acid oxidase-like deaminating enzyme